MLGDEDGGAPPLAAEGDPLDEAQTDEGDGREQADLTVGGQQADREGGRPIMMTVTRKAPLRPVRSPIRPNISAPSGRKAKPAANEPRAKT